MARAEKRSARVFLPEEHTLSSLREAAADCRGCDLYRKGTQTVFGEGPTRARVMLVGEQPGDKEDVAGRPFVGPAGRMLDKALDDAGIPRDATYVTNAVKHFKWKPVGKRRIHEKPNAGEIRACNPWLEAEIEVVRPEVIVCLGATAAQAMMGPKFRLTAQRGVLLEAPHGEKLLATAHPSSLLRAPDEESRRGAYRLFVRDLRKVARHLATAR